MSCVCWGGERVASTRGLASLADACVCQDCQLAPLSWLWPCVHVQTDLPCVRHVSRDSPCMACVHLGQALLASRSAVQPAPKWGFTAPGVRLAQLAGRHQAVQCIAAIRPQFLIQLGPPSMSTRAANKMLPLKNKPELAYIGTGSGCPQITAERASHLLTSMVPTSVDAVLGLCLRNCVLAARSSPATSLSTAVSSCCVLLSSCVAK